MLAAVDAIPRGRVMSYGDVAEYCALGGSRPAARTVGRVLARDGGSVSWYRVVHADGSLAPQVADRQRTLLEAEGVRFVGDRVDLRAHRWDGG